MRDRRRPLAYEQLLSGGVANAGAVVRRGEHVLRPATQHSGSIHAFLAALREAGFEGVPSPDGFADHGRERLEFIAGDVPVPPYPEWAQSDTALASTAALLARMHAAATAFDASGYTWSAELADPRGGHVVCHNDVCLENVVFRNGDAVALIDFDFAAPGRPIHDVAQFARMCVPMDDDANAERLGWRPADRPARLRLVADAYGLDLPLRHLLLELLDDSIAHGGEFVLRRVEAGDPNFTAMWNEIGGMKPFDRRRRWWRAHRTSFLTALS